MEKDTYIYSIEADRVDLSNQANCYSMGVLLLNAAGRSANNHGFGIDQLLPQGLSWVLSRFGYAMSRYPHEGEIVTIETWVESVGKLMTIRNFRVLDASAQTIGYGITYWAMIDVASRRPQDIATNPFYQNCARAEGVEIDAPQKIVVKNGVKIGNHRIKYSDLDFNRHATSMKYLQWILDSMEFSEVISKPVRRVDMNFLHESRQGELLDVVAERETEQMKFDLRRAEISVCCVKLSF